MHTECLQNILPERVCLKHKPLNCYSFLVSSPHLYIQNLSQHYGEPVVVNKTLDCKAKFGEQLELLLCETHIHFVYMNKQLERNYHRVDIYYPQRRSSE